MKRMKNVLMVLALTTTFTACSAEVDAPESEQVAPVDDSVSEAIQRILEFNPGSKQVGAYEVQLEEGVSIIVDTEALDGVNPKSASGRCLGGNLCLFEHADFKGSILQLSGPCKYVNLANYNTDQGHPWTNKASSIDNPVPRPGSGTAYFYNNGAFMKSLKAGGYLKNLTRDASAEGGNCNDKIDTLWTC